MADLWNLSSDSSDDFLRLLQGQTSSAGGIPGFHLPPPSTSALAFDLGQPHAQSDDDEGDNDDDQRSLSTSTDHKRKKGPVQATAKKGKALKASADTSADEDKKPAARSRKATGASAAAGPSEPKEEGKANKRKEQNRAAQRAFRERKEKHVKDLEDKVALLEASTEGQKAENENLRDLLTRLQQENMQLKQASFTFSFPESLSASAGSSSSAPAPAPAPAQSSGSSTKPPVSSPESFSSSSGSSYDNSRQHHRRTSPSHHSASYSSSNGESSSASPSSALRSLSSGPDTPPVDPLFSSHFNAFSSSASGPLAGKGPVKSEVATPAPYAFSPIPFSPPASSASASASAYFPPLDVSPFQTLSSNPLFTSFREPSAPTGFDDSLNFYSAFGAADPISSSSALYPSHFDDFYQLPLATPSSSSTTTHAGPAPSLAPPSPLDEQPMSPGTFDNLMASILNASPQQPADSPSALSVSSTASSAPPNDECAGVGCPTPAASSASASHVPREEQTPSPLISSTSASSAVHPPSHGRQPLPEHLIVAGPGCKGKLTEQEMAGLLDGSLPYTHEVYERMFDGQNMLAADPKEKHLKFDQVWSRIRASPVYDPATFDVDSLCSEFSGKARCDGSGPVLGEHTIQQFLAEMPNRTKQHKP